MLLPSPLVVIPAPPAPRLCSGCRGYCIQPCKPPILPLSRFDPVFYWPSLNPLQDDARRSNDAPRCRRPRRLGHGRRTTPKPVSPVCSEQRPQLDLCGSMARGQQMMMDCESLRTWSVRMVRLGQYTTTARDQNQWRVSATLHDRLVVRATPVDNHTCAESSPIVRPRVAYWLHL